MFDEGNTVPVLLRGKSAGIPEGFRRDRDLRKQQGPDQVHAALRHRCIQSLEFKEAF